MTAEAAPSGRTARVEIVHKEKTMPSISQQNFETVVVNFVGALARGDVGAASALLDPDVVWWGLRD
jgi:hypothetical protein